MKTSLTRTVEQGRSKIRSSIGSDIRIGEEASGFKMEPSIVNTGPVNTMFDEEEKSRQEVEESTEQVNRLSDLVPAVHTGGISPSQKTLKIPKLDIGASQDQMGRGLAPQLHNSEANLANLKRAESQKLQDE